MSTCKATASSLRFPEDCDDPNKREPPVRRTQTQVKLVAPFVLRQAPLLYNIVQEWYALGIRR